MPADREYQMCSRCVLDTNGDPFISFDNDGVCNYCREYDVTVVPERKPADIAAKELREIVSRIKADGKNLRYDCIMGLSGGADSSYIAYLARQYELRPLVVHLDNGWDAELAVKNIENILRKTGFDYYNHVVDWEEFKDLQLAYLKASVIDMEVVTDQAITALLHRLACKWKIKYILTGDNPATERIMPRGWSYQKNDLANLRAIHKKFGKLKIRTYPLLGVYDTMFCRQVRGIKCVSLLHYVQYDYERVRQTLATEFGWRDYEWKHCESVFTKFYQGYILPRKFNVDKRRAHLSDLVLSGQIPREDALEKLDSHYYYDRDAFETDHDFVLRKFNLSREEFEGIMAAPIIAHQAFPQERIGRWDRVKLLFWRCLFNPRGLAGAVRLRLEHRIAAPRYQEP